MVFDSTVPSSRGSLTPQRYLELANSHLENAYSANNPDIAVELCRDAEDKLSKARKGVKKVQNQTVEEDIATAYVSLGKLLESHGFVNESRACFKKAEKYG